MDVRLPLPRFPFMCWVAHRPLWVGVGGVVRVDTELFSSSVAYDSMAMMGQLPGEPSLWLNGQPPECCTTPSTRGSGWTDCSLAGRPDVTAQMIKYC